MRSLWFRSVVLLLCSLAACSVGKEETSDTPTISEVSTINDFVPDFVVSIPQFRLPFKAYYQYVVDDYVVNGVVDSAGMKQGYWKIQDVKRHLTYQGTYANDLLHGWWEVLSHHKLICAGHYFQSRKQGYWGYLQLGPKKASKFVNYQNDTLFGLAREFTVDSVLLSSGNYKNGLKDGYWDFYTDKGQLKEQGDYYDNYKSGWWKYYDDSARLIKEASYSRGEIAGYVKLYQNGIKWGEGQQFNAKNWGSWKYYDATGNLIKIEEFGGF